MEATYSEEAKEQIYRRNFPFFLTDGILFLVALGMIGSTTVIPDFVGRLTDSEILIGISGNLFEIGWTLPQLLVARYVIRIAKKKWWFILPNIPTRFVILAFGVATFLLGADRPGMILVAFFICYSIAAFGDGLVAIPWADLSGTSMSEQWRARVFGIQSAVTGLIMLAVTPLIGLILSRFAFPNNYALLFGISGLFFVISIFPVIFVHELPGGKAKEQLPPLQEYLPELGQVLKTDTAFRAILIARILTILFAMSGPFYIGFATSSLGMSSEVAVPTLLAMQTIGSIVGAILYTWLGARNNLMYIRLALFCGALWPASALLAAAFGPTLLYAGYLMSGLAMTNLVLGFYNWVVTYATPDNRPNYVGLFNTIAALMSIAVPFIAGTVVQNFGYRPLFTISLAMALIALYVTVRYVRNVKQEEVQVTEAEA